MKSISELLKLKEKMKEEKPVFTRQEYPARKNLELKWRKPKGIHSKMRKKHKGKKVQPSVGYSLPKRVRGLSRDGLKFFLVKSLGDLNNATAENLIILSKLIGMKKRIELLKKIKERGLKILNIKDIEKEIEKLNISFEKRKKEKTERKRKGKDGKEKGKTTKQEEKKELSLEEKKKEEQEEKRKVLVGKK